MLWTAALAAAFASAQPSAPVATVDVIRNGKEWTADYRLSAEAPVWVFADSILPREGKTSFRERSWTVVTPGVRLERRGWYDVLVADRGTVPQRVTIRFTPFTEDIEASYDAALAFTDGSVALYDKKFKIFPAAAVNEVDKLPIDVGEIAAAEVPTRVRMRDSGGDILLGGRKADSATLDDAATYVLFGKAEPTESKAMFTILDPGLPNWLSGFLLSSIPAVLDHYAEALGPAPGGKPLLLATWGGATPGLNSMGGSVLESMMVMSFEGDALNEENAGVRNGARWFAAHEGAHFWLGQAVSYERPQDGWITEGGADLMAYRAVAAIDPSFDARAALQQALEACVAFSRKGGIASANERGDHKAYYHCGAIFGLVAERASGGDFRDFVGGLIESNRNDKVVSRAEWLAALDARAPGKGLGVVISRLLDAPAATLEPWAALLAHGGVRHRLTPDGAIELQ